MTDPAPAELLNLARQGDEEALGRLLSAYRKYLSFLASVQIDRRLQGKADASDIVQDAFVEAHRHFDQFRGQSDGEFAAWLRSILAGLIANHLRRHLGTKQRDARLERGLNVELDDTSCVLERGLPAAGSTPSEQAVRRENGLLLAAALEQLPPDYRQTIVLRNFENLPFSEIAVKMNRSVDSVQKLWMRALAQLRKSLPRELK